MYHISIRDEATEEAIESYLWYEERQMGLGEEFLDALEACFERIGQRPESFPTVHKEFRQALVKRFPFVIFFEIQEKEIIVFSVFHTKRKPWSWRKRRR